MRTSETTFQNNRLAALGVSLEDAHALRLSSRGLTRWYTLECGDGNDYASWAIERDENDIPEMVTYHNSGKTTRRRVRDMERFHQKRIVAICAKCNLHYYLQTDPRGASLYISANPIDICDYNRNSVCVY